MWANERLPRLYPKHGPFHERLRYEFSSWRLKPRLRDAQARNREARLRGLERPTRSAGAEWPPGVLSHVFGMVQFYKMAGTGSRP